jgi:hypothetical protein
MCEFMSSAGIPRYSQKDGECVDLADTLNEEGASGMLPKIMRLDHQSLDHQSLDHQSLDHQSLDHQSIGTVHRILYR